MTVMQDLRYRATVIKLKKGTATIGEVARCIQLAFDTYEILVEAHPNRRAELSTLAMLIVGARDVPIADPNAIAEAFEAIDKAILVVRGEREKT